MENEDFDSAPLELIIRDSEGVSEVETRIILLGAQPLILIEPTEEEGFGFSVDCTDLPLASLGQLLVLLGETINTQAALEAANNTESENDK